jgi:hypothetical protein
MRGPVKDPVRDFQSVHARMAENIARTGRLLMSTVDVWGNAFTYTIGNSLKGVPELIVFGLAPENAHWVLNMASDQPEAIASGIIDLGGEFPLKAVPCGAWAKDVYSIQAGQYLRGNAYELTQLLVCDKAGRFPDDPACTEPYAHQPKLWLTPEGKSE